MLEALFISKSKIRQDLLILFFTDPSKSYYLRELQRMLGHSAGSIRRELLKFQKDSLFVTQKVGNLLYYRLNTAHPLFEELKSIVSKTVGVEGSLRKELSSVKGIKTAFIYGSFAAKREKSGSDIDLMIIGNPDSSVLNEKIAGLEKKLQREINVTTYSPEEYKYRREANSGFILDVVKNPKILLAGAEDDL
jgi:predicted nucleotidyltransferase